MNRAKKKWDLLDALQLVFVVGMMVVIYLSPERREPLEASKAFVAMAIVLSAQLIARSIDRNTAWAQKKTPFD